MKRAHLVEEDEKKEKDERTALVIKGVANSICEYIQVQIDCASMHKNNLLPILDLEVEMKENNVLYRYYRKPMANTKLIMASSAMPYSMKKTCLIQEVVRILRNTSRKLDKCVKTAFLSEFCLRLKESGYPDKMRYEIVKRGVEVYEKQLERDENNICPLYRPKRYEDETRKNKKHRAQMSWYKPYDTVLFIPPTPNSELAKKFKEIVEKQKAEGGIKIKVVEKAGVKLGSLLPGLREKEDCGRENCFVHTTGGKGMCNRENIVYKGQCLTCSDRGKESVYIGETSRSGFVRGKQHMDAIGNHTKSQSNAFARHISEYHNSQETKFKLDIVKYNKTPLERQVREEVEIVRAKADIMMNSKMEYFQPGIRKLKFGDVY